MGSVRYVALAVLAAACGFKTPAGAPADARLVDAPPGDGDGDVPDPDAPDAPAAMCGDAIVEQGEECDDGDGGMPEDGCDEMCHIQPGWICPQHATCMKVVGVVLTPREQLAAAGTSMGGTAFSYPCMPGQAIVGFEGESSNDDMDFGRLRAGCAALTFGPGGTAKWMTIANTQYAGFEMGGALGMDKCPMDSVVVGYTANAGVYLSGLAIHCAPISVVHGALAIGAPTTLTVYGPATRTMQPATDCAAGEVAGAFEGASGSVLDHFDLRCYQISPLAMP